MGFVLTHGNQFRSHGVPSPLPEILLSVLVLPCAFQRGYQKEPLLIVVVNDMPLIYMGGEPPHANPWKHCPSHPNPLSLD